jgi:hypothetical protein
MKIEILAKFLLSALLLAGSQLALRAQNYSIDWHKVAAGGGTSTGGLFAVNGTIGQHDAASLSGGAYSLAGGFWGLVAAVQTPGAPLLTLARAGTASLIISWPSSSGSNCTLQSTTDLNANTAWTTVPQIPSQVGDQQSVTIPTSQVTQGRQFFRLVRP